MSSHACVWMNVCVKYMQPTVSWDSSGNLPMSVGSVLGFPAGWRTHRQGLLVVTWFSYLSNGGTIYWISQICDGEASVFTSPVFFFFNACIRDRHKQGVWVSVIFFGGVASALSFCPINSQTYLCLPCHPCNSWIILQLSIQNSLFQKWLSDLLL